MIFRRKTYTRVLSSYHYKIYALSEKNIRTLIMAFRKNLKKTVKLIVQKGGEMSEKIQF